MDWEGLTGVIIELGVIAGLVLKFFSVKKAKKKLLEENTSLKIDLESCKKEITMLEGEIKSFAGIDDRIPRPDSFIISVMDNDLYYDIICGIKKKLKAERVELWVGENYKLGIGMESFPENQHDRVVITHECKDPWIPSSKESLKEVPVWKMATIIEQMQKNNGYTIVNHIDDLKTEKDSERHRMAEVAGIITVGDFSVMSPESGHTRSYMVGALVVAYVTKERKFLKEDFSLIKNATDKISLLLEDEFRDIPD